MFLRVDIKDPKTAQTKTVAKARLVKGFTPAAKANKLIQALDKNPTSTATLVLSNYSRATSDGFPALQAWEDKEQALEAIRVRTYRRGKDTKPRQVSPNSLASLNSFNKDTRTNKPKTAPWESAPKAKELRLEGWTWKAIGQELGCKDSTVRYMVEGFSPQIKAMQAALRSEE